MNQRDEIVDSLPTDAEALRRRVEQLEHERDDLRSEVETLRAVRHRQGAPRAVALFVLVVLACTSLTGATVGVWSTRSLLDNEVFAERAGPLGADPAVQAALSVWITDQLMEVANPEELFREALPERGRLLAVPLAGAVRGFVHDQVRQLLATPAFADLWARSVTVAHARAVEVVRGESEVVLAEQDRIVVNLVPLVNAALARVGEASPQLFGVTVDLPTLTVDDLPATAQQRLADALGVPVDDDFGVVVIEDRGSLAAAQDMVRLIDRVVWVLVAIALVSTPVALWISRRRRRTLLQLAAGMAVGLVLVRRLGLRLEGDALDRIADPVVRDAARAVVTSFVDPLLQAAAIGLWVLAAVAALALLTGPYRWAVAARRETVRAAGAMRGAAGRAGEKATDETTVAWLRANVGALQVGGLVVAVLAMAILDLSWTGLFVILVLLVAYQGAVWWIGQAATAEPSPPATGT